MSEYNEGFAFPKPTKRLKKPRAPLGNPYKAASMDQEDQLAADLTNKTGIQFERVPMSGAAKEHPGDVRTNRRVREPSHKFLIEAKIVEETTGRGEKQLTIKLEWLDQIIKEAFEENSLPVLVTQFRGDDRRFVTMRFSDMARLLAEHKSMQDELNQIPIRPQ